MALTTVTIQRFKNVNDCHFPIDKLNVLIGPNNCGKTSIIQSIHFAFSTIQSLNISKKWPPKRLKTVTINPNELVYLPSNDPYCLGKGGQLREDPKSAIEVEFSFDDGQQAKVVLRKGRIKNILVEPTNSEYARALSTLENPYSVYSPGLAGIARSENYVSDGILLRALARGDANAYLRNILYRLQRENDKWTRFEKDLSDMFPNTEIVIHYDEDIDEYIDIYVTQNGNKIPLDLSGTGLLQCVHILSYYHLFRPKVILLDEPDSHLHPNNQRLLCSLLSALTSEHELSVVMTTHSRHVIDALSDDAALYWIESGKASPATHEDQIDLLLDLGALDIKEKINIPDTKAIILSEDKDKKPIELLLENSNFDLTRTLILSYKGITSINHLEPLIKQVKSNSNAAVLVHRDRDFLEPDEVEDWKVHVRSLGVEPFVTKQIDIEEYFVSEAILQHLENSIPAFNCDEAYKEIIEHCKDEAIRDFVNGRVVIERMKGNAAKINHGDLAVSAHNKFRSSPLDLIKGKKKRAWFRGYFQMKFNLRFDREIDSTLIKDESLERAGRKIFGTS